MTIYFCYLLEFANKKIYVGMSRTDTKGRYDSRYNQHAADARKGIKQNPVYNAWRKHGAPTQIVLSEHATRDECAATEVALIAILSACNPAIGYNVQSGGQGMHAPKDSPMWHLMNERVWSNPEVRAKLSVANKGKQPSPQAIAAANEWRSSPEGRERMKKSWQSHERRALASERTREQMTPDARANLSAKLKGHLDMRSVEGKERQRASAKRDMTVERAQTMRAKMLTDLDAARRQREGLQAWRESEANAEHCRAMARANATRMQRPVRHVATGVEYPSCAALAEAMGYAHQSYVSRLIAQGKVVRI